MTLKELRKILDGIAEQHSGHITAELVVELAKNPNHPLHNEFEWNDAVAAYQYRLAQARRMLRVRVAYKDNGRIVVVPCYVRDPNCKPNEQGKISLTVAQRREEDALAVVQGYLDRVEANAKIGHSVAISLGLETAWLAGMERIVAMMRPGPKKKKFSAVKP